MTRLLVLHAGHSRSPAVCKSVVVSNTEAVQGCCQACLLVCQLPDATLVDAPREDISEQRKWVGWQKIAAVQICQRALSGFCLHASPIAGSRSRRSRNLMQGAQIKHHRQLSSVTAMLRFSVDRCLSRHCDQALNEACRRIKPARTPSLRGAILGMFIKSARAAAC